MSSFLLPAFPPNPSCTRPHYRPSLLLFLFPLLMDALPVSAQRRESGGENVSLLLQLVWPPSPLELVLPWPFHHVLSYPIHATWPSFLFSFFHSFPNFFLYFSISPFLFLFPLSCIYSDIKPPSLHLTVSFPILTLVLFTHVTVLAPFLLFLVDPIASHSHDFPSYVQYLLSLPILSLSPLPLLITILPSQWIPSCSLYYPYLVQVFPSLTLVSDCLEKQTQTWNLDIVALMGGQNGS